MLYWISLNLARIVGRIFFRHRTLHRERLPESGGALIVANHVSYLDPAAVGIAFRKPIHYLARKSLFKGFLGWLLPRIQVLPVDRGKGDLGSMKRILGLLKDGQRVLMFPEGTRSPDGQLQPAADHRAVQHRHHRHPAAHPLDLVAGHLDALVWLESWLERFAVAGRALTAATICSASLCGTRGSFLPWMT